MRQPTALRPTLTGTVLNLRSITRGYRLISWLAGRSEYPWIDRWVGRLALRLALARGVRTGAAWPGPIWSKTPFGAPLLSWFIVPVSDTGPDGFAGALNAALEHDPSAGTSHDVARLMQRVLPAQATSRRQR